MQKVFKRISNSKTRLARILGVAGVYILFWAVFYGSQIILPKNWSLYIAKNTGVLMPIYIFVIVPLVSFFIPVYILRHMRAKPWVVYTVHVLVLILSILAYFTISLLKIYTSIGVEDFVS
jgi:hypothetical protein